VYKPFGNGKRSCIGRGFAWQEAQLVLAVLLQNFDIQLHDPSYQLKIKQTLTIKPDNFQIRVKPRHNATAVSVSQLVHGGQYVDSKTKGAPPAEAEHVDGTNKKPLTIVYGSNTGTCQALAQRAAADAAGHGFVPSVSDMDSAVGSLSKNAPVIIFTSSYEGEPPDNAVKFMGWLNSVQAESLAGVEYAVFGCGHRKYDLFLVLNPLIVRR
jgi:cytochrome P450 / NADPH-cytochrome P450 reductase